MLTTIVSMSRSGSMGSSPFSSSAMRWNASYASAILSLRGVTRRCTSAVRKMLLTAQLQSGHFLAGVWATLGSEVADTAYPFR